MGGKDVLGSSGHFGEEGAFYRSPRNLPVEKLVQKNLDRRLWPETFFGPETLVGPESLRSFRSEYSGSPHGVQNIQTGDFGLETSGSDGRFRPTEKLQKHQYENEDIFII